MTRYSELAKLWWTNQQKFNDVYTEHEQLALRLVRGFAAYLEVPGSDFHFADIHEDESTAGIVAEDKAVSFGSDGWFWVRFRIDFKPGGPLDPTLLILFTWSLRSQDGRWLVRLSPDDSEIDIGNGNDGTRLQEFYRAADTRMEKWLNRNIADVARQDREHNQVGFHATGSGTIGSSFVTL